ncbi:hypothetical protein IDH44_14325 [Paenibacillus sp. IB182496]|uniref:Uncharacterized protein n=1 Tax=Paenibacillus sabuli TaxID=2772509 RepID=A0A927GSK3_9BACL|nr:hypothetical protein [Paenibacillus sabuli]MBD2846376.1 hypothetical protein [Paenibacillus sabuli]
MAAIIKSMLFALGGIAMTIIAILMDPSTETNVPEAAPAEVVAQADSDLQTEQAEEDAGEGSETQEENQSATSSSETVAETEGPRSPLSVSSLVR